MEHFCDFLTHLFSTQNIAILCLTTIAMASIYRITDNPEVIVIPIITAVGGFVAGSAVTKMRMNG